MKDWLTKLASSPKSEEEVLHETIRSLPPELLNEVAGTQESNLDAMQAKIAEAARKGQELAQQYGDELEKQAMLGTLLSAAKGFATGGVGGAAANVAKDTVINGATKAVSNSVKAPSATGALGSGFSYGKVAGLNLSNLARQGVGFLHRNPGAAVTLAGAGAGALMAPRDPQTGQKQYMRGAMIGGGLAAGANALSQGQIANKAKQMVTRQNNPIFGQGVRRYATESAYATRPGAAGMGGVSGAGGAANAASSAYRGGPVEGQVKLAEERTDVDRARHYGRVGAGAGAALTAARLFANRDKVAPIFARNPGAALVGTALAGSMNAGIGYGLGRLTHRLAHGPATGKPLEKDAFMLVDDLIGGAIGHRQGTLQRERGENYSFGGPQVAGTLLVPGGAGYQVGRYFAHHPSPEHHHEKKANRQTLTYDPATKTFIRQHLTPDMSVGETGSDVIPAGHTEPVMQGAAGRGQYAGQVAPPGPAAGGMAQTHMLHGGNVMSSTPRPGVAARPAAVPPPIPMAARAGGAGGLAAAAAKPRMPSLAGAMSLAKK